MLENVHGSRRYHNCFWKPWSYTPRRDIGPCGDVYKPALSAWKRYLTSQGTKMAYMYVQKKYQANRMGFLQTKGRFCEAILRAHYKNDSLEQ